MADPRMSQNAARLSEDIGDVLSAIRRMIADDDALSDARDRVRSERSGLIQDDAGDFLARRYGGDAALARQMVQTAARPAPATLADDSEARPAIPQFILRPAPAPAAAKGVVAKAPAPVSETPLAEVAPLRLGAERRIDEAPATRPSGWRAWLRSDPAETQAPSEPAAPPLAGTGIIMGSPAGDDGEDFAEAFDWKARMRPEIEAPVQAAVSVPKGADQRLSGWVSASGASDPVARLAAEAAAFDAEMQAQADLEAAALAVTQQVEDQSIRELLRDMVQTELNGELGERFSANLRAVIRREVAAAIDTHLDRF